MAQLKKRTGYFLAFLVVLAVEILIGLFVNDHFVRPYVGDVLVTVLLCCLCRAIAPSFPSELPVFLFATFVELLQGLEVTEKLGLDGTIWAIVLGTTCDFKDLLCYGAGCGVFAAANWLICKKYFS